MVFPLSALPELKESVKKAEYKKEVSCRGFPDAHIVLMLLVVAAVRQLQLPQIIMTLMLVVSLADSAGGPGAKPGKKSTLVASCCKTDPHQVLAGVFSSSLPDRFYKKCMNMQKQIALCPLFHLDCSYMELQ